MQRILAAQKIQEEASKPRSKKTLKPKIDSISKVKKNINESDKTKIKDKNKFKDLDKKQTKDKSNDSKSKSKKEAKDKKEKRNKEHKKDKDKKKDKKKKKKDSVSGSHSKGVANLQTSDINDDLDPQVFDECKEKMRPVKKALKALDKPDSSLSKSEQKAHYMQHLRTIGSRIDECLREFSSDPIKSKEWRNHLWTFVSKFTEYHAKKLYKLYKHSLKTSEQKDSDGTHISRRERHERHYEKQSSTHSSSFGSLKRESTGSIPPNKQFKKREDYNQFQSKPSISYTGGTNVHNAIPAQSSMHRNSWPKHDNISSSRPMPYERDNRVEQYNKALYSRDDETDRKYRYTNDRQRYREPNQASTQSQHSGQYMHSQRNTQYQQHFFPHSSVSVPVNNLNVNQQNAYQSWPPFNNPRDAAYYRNQTDNYSANRRPNCSNPEEKPPLNR
jgi:chromodomain-helicase-DNA-binding protein 1